MKIIGKSNPAKRPKKFLVRMTVSFGPAFHPGPLTRREFIAKLREAASRRPASFLGPMFSHFADHIEAAAKKFPHGEYGLDAPANLDDIFNTYGGEGSCPGCSVSHPGGSCCSCEHEGITSCEPCG
jgi:hypothetical protein